MTALSPRESEVLFLSASGCSQREVAARLGVSRNEVRRSLDRAQQRLNAATLPQAVALAARDGLIDLTQIPGGPHA